MKKDKVNEWIGRMSCFNAAERSWTSEGSARMKFRDEIANEVKTWEITEDEFLDLYNQCCRQLTTSSDFTYFLRLNKAFKGA